MSNFPLNVLAKSDNGILASVKHHEKPYYGVQFHPEVVHTSKGNEILSNFLFDISGCEGNWTSENFITNAVDSIKKTIGNKNVICGISGGVDSSVMGALMYKAIGDHAKFIFVNHGLLRKNEEQEVMKSLKDGIGMDINCINASNVFLKELEGITNPERKRKIIGKLFYVGFISF